MDLNLDFELAKGYPSGSQVARVVTESWVAKNLPCLLCGSGRLVPTPPNTPARDFQCGRPECAEPYELKARNGSFGHVVVDGSYATLSGRWCSGQAANLLLLGYDKSERVVRDLFVVHRSLLSLVAIQKRPPLPPTARRAGWTGANILLDQLPAGALSPVVRHGVIFDLQPIRAQWGRHSFINQLSVSDRGWIADVLACIRRLPNRVFTVSDAYGFEGELGKLHPRNLNVRPKIRQQLQLLVAYGLAQRMRRGLYCLVA